jgi:DNA-directed RNA polymerase specialized sigma24 family protein
MEEPPARENLGARIEKAFAQLRATGMSNEQIWSRFYEDLRILARKKAGPAAGMSATSIVHELWLRTFGKQDFDWESGKPFMPYIARSMQNLLTDEFRRRGRSTTVKTDHPATGGRDWNTTIDLAEALEQLEKQDARQADIVRLINWTGCSEAETAGVLGYGLSTVKKDPPHEG